MVGVRSESSLHEALRYRSDPPTPRSSILGQDPWCQQSAPFFPPRSSKLRTGQNGASPQTGAGPCRTYTAPARRPYEYDIHVCTR